MTQVITKAPCKHCPFRKDVPCYLHRERRVEIASVLLSGNSFPCHAQVDYSQEDEHGETIPDSSNAAMCSGAAKSLLLAGTGNNYMRVMHRLGALDLHEVEDHPIEVWDIHEWQTLTEGDTGDSQAEEEEVETCTVVNPGCLAPAGYAVGGGVAYGTEAADDHCQECGEPVCSNCLTEDGYCDMCSEVDEDE